MPPPISRFPILDSRFQDPAPGAAPLFHPDLHPYDQACNETTAALEAGRRRQLAAAKELRAATTALPVLQAAATEASDNWGIACAAFRDLHGLPPQADLGYEVTRHLPTHG